MNIDNEKDMLNGNIVRMCLTNDIDELNAMKKVALQRIENIYELNYQRFIDSLDDWGTNYGRI